MFDFEEDEQRSGVDIRRLRLMKRSEVCEDERP